MTPADELRRMLDERGVEHYDHECGEPLRDLMEGGEDPATSWRMGDANVCAVPAKDGTFALWIDHATPAQAAAATLGAEPDDAVMRKLHDRMNSALIEFERANGIERANAADVVSLLVKLHEIIECAATVAAGTCEMRDAEGSFCSVNRPVYICECGAFCTDYSGATTYFKPRYCPNCDRRVERGDA